MARPLRLHIPNAVYHVMSRGNNKQCIFTDETDYQQYLQCLSRVLPRFSVRCYGYCLLVNHVHLVLSPLEHPVSSLMQQLNSKYCQWFNRRHQRVGHVLQGRFRSLIVDSDQYFLRLIRYVLRNPVTAGLTSDAADWPWSSYAAAARLNAAPGFLDLTPMWSALGAGATPVERCFEDFMDVADDTSFEDEFVLGSAAFMDEVEPVLATYREVADYRYRERFATRPALDELFRGIDGRHTLVRAARTAFHEYAYTLREIGTFVGRDPTTIWTWVHDIDQRRAPRRPATLQTLEISRTALVTRPEEQALG